METAPLPETGGEERNFGPQPLDALMDELAVENHALVAASTEQLTHKQVQKGRKGRRLTPSIQRKIVHALNALCAAQGIERKFQIGDLFTYDGRS
ncbi:MAG: hypothetical protein KDL87_08170 [Verrucomicrobiae bacterium]|nr:hypothetical protein [Verrucomicrobiae bacterium]